VVGSCECGNDRLDSIQREEYLDQLRNCELSKKKSAP